MINFDQNLIQVPSRTLQSRSITVGTALAQFDQRPAANHLGRRAFRDLIRDARSAPWTAVVAT